MKNIIIFYKKFKINFRMQRRREGEEAKMEWGKVPISVGMRHHGNDKNTEL